MCGMHQTKKELQRKNSLFWTPFDGLQGVSLEEILRLALAFQRAYPNFCVSDRWTFRLPFTKDVQTLAPSLIAFSSCWANELLELQFLVRRPAE